MKKIISLLIIMMGLVIPSASLYAQEKPVELSADDAQFAAKTITDNYNDWKRVTLSGKLDLEDVAISPSVKIYMEKGRRIVISIRVPLLGEVGTVDITPAQVTLVNKVKKTYCREDISSLIAGLPVGISELQDLFLGRIFLPSYGTLSMSNYEKADFYESSDVEGWFILPKEQPVEYKVACGYNTYSDGRTDNMFVGTLDGENQASAYYTYDNNKCNIDLTVRTKGKDREFTFRINETNYAGSPVKAAQIDGKYRKEGIKDFFKKLL